MEGLLEKRIYHIDGRNGRDSCNKQWCPLAPFVVTFAATVSSLSVIITISTILWNLSYLFIIDKYIFPLFHYHLWYENIFIDASECPQKT